MFQRQSFVPNKSTSLQTRLATEAHLAEGQFLLEEQTLNIESLWYIEEEPEDQQFPKQKGKI
jgi:hypothetical protein